MGYDREERPGERNERPRWAGDRHRNERSHRDDHRDHDRHGDRDRGQGDRGFFERAGDEISSWFGGDDDRGDRDRHEPHGRGDQREWLGGREQRSRGDDGRDYRPMTGDYGRRPERMRGGGAGRGEDRVQPVGRSEWDRDEYRRTSFAGSRAESNHEDAHYRQCRERHMAEFDREYDEFRRENRSNFENDFGGWRERKQDRRQLLGRVRERMEVCGNDGRHLGTVDRVAGDRIILTKSDPEADGVHHSLSCTDIERIEGDRVILETSAEKAKQRWSDESRGRALFERDDQGSSGPHMLDRSFSGTYR